MSVLSPRFLALPALALAVIFGLAQAHSQAGLSGEAAPTVLRASTCATPAATACAFAGSAGVLR